jgi:hypothetical protein
MDTACKADPVPERQPRVGTAGVTRTPVPQLKRLVSSLLSYSGKSGAASQSRTEQARWAAVLQTAQGPSLANAT